VSLTEHFDLNEFRCPCCGDVIESAARALAEQLEPVRAEYGPILIWSGYRCPRHNAKVGGRLFSKHLTGQAADIAVSSDADRYSLLTELVKNGFRRLGIAARYIHADNADARPPMIWTYY